MKDKTRDSIANYSEPTNAHQCNDGLDAISGNTLKQREIGKYGSLEPFLKPYELIIFVLIRGSEQLHALFNIASWV
ncbi:MAG: hypothetical protein J6X55_05885 [Victivallales bacterium]|nr:hypothetical protein [Victivallales bacterium]